MAALLHAGGKLYGIHMDGLLRIGMEGGRFLLTFAEDFPQPQRSLKLIGEVIQEFEKTFE